MTLLAEPTATAIPSAVASRYADTYQRLIDQQTMIDALRMDLANNRGDDVDQAAASLLLEEQVTLAHSLQDQLDELDTAAHSVGYGVCERCHKPIPAERLEIFPATTMCVSCKSAASRR